MALAELSQRGIGKFFRRTPQSETPLNNTVGADLPVCPVSEGDDLTGGSDLVIPTEPQHLVVKIVGSRDPFTGEIASYHKDVHGTYKQYPLSEGTAVNVI